jgi:hypothetical protein
MARRVSSSLTAAGAPLRVANYEEATQLQLSRQEWTTRAWSYYENVGEVRYAANFIANALSRLRLIAATTPSASSDQWEPQVVTEGAVAEAVHRLQDPRGGQRGLMRSLGLNLFVPGEAFLLGQQIDNVQLWECLSSDELDVRTGYPQFYRKTLPNVTPQPIPDTALVIRIWKEHPRWSQLADSAMRTVLDQCETLLLLTRMERAAARSRFAGSGILFVPNELLPSGSRGESDTDFYAKLMESMIAPIKDETHPSSVVPILLTGPAEYGRSIQHITMDRAIEGDGLVRLKEDAVKRLAAAFDLPSEVLTGNTDLNHWGMAVVREETFSAHIQPFAEMVVDALTIGYLHPALRRAGVKNWSEYCVWFDSTELVQKADRFESAIQAHDRMVISNEALRKAGQFSESDAPEDEEYAQRVGLKMVQPRMAVTGELPPEPPTAPPAGAAAAPAPEGGEAGSGSDSRGRNLETVQSGNAPKGARAQAPTQPSERRVSPDATTPQTSVTAAAEYETDFSLSRQLAEIDMITLSKLQTLMQAALQRTAEKAGAKIRTKTLGNEAVRASLDGVPNGSVPAALGRSLVASLGFDLSDLIDSSMAEFAGELASLIVDAYLTTFDALEQLRERAASEGLPTTVDWLTELLDQAVLQSRSGIRSRLQSEDDTWSETAWLRDLVMDNLAAADSESRDRLRELADKYIFGDGAAVDPSGEASSFVIQPGDVRSILVKAGGGSPVSNYPLNGGIATGRTVIQYVDTLGTDVNTELMIWTYGQVPRKQGFQGHMQLDGAVFTTMDDPVLSVWPEDRWIRVSHYRPGDHLGCACIVAPYVPVV